MLFVVDMVAEAFRECWGVSATMVATDSLSGSEAREGRESFCLLDLRQNSFRASGQRTLYIRWAIVLCSRIVRYPHRPFIRAGCSVIYALCYVTSGAMQYVAARPIPLHDGMWCVGRGCAQERRGHRILLARTPRGPKVQLRRPSTTVLVEKDIDKKLQKPSVLVWRTEVRFSGRRKRPNWGPLTVVPGFPVI